jgi:predicted Zn-dependent peptidase
MLFLVVNRPATPQVAVRLAVRAGSALEEAGRTGIAHMLEHMLFKGTRNFGTSDWRRDAKLQEQIEAAFQVIKAERQRRQPNQVLIDQKEAEMARLRQEVQQIYIPQAFSAQLGKNGAIDVNAFTSTDQTQYTASVPSDMLEQWFSIISEQVFEPAWREFYVEREVIQREWAFRYINNPNGAAWLDLNALAYTAHPYRNPVIGWKADMEKFSTQDARRFHQRHYNPTNAVCVLVGDVGIDQARRLAEIYFARYPAGERAPEVVTREPLQQGPRENIRYLPGARSPLVRIGFHGPAMGSDDFFALDALTMIMSSGRGAHLQREMIEKGLAAEAWAYNPDNRYGTLIVMGGSPLMNGGNGDQTEGGGQSQEGELEATRQVAEQLLAQIAHFQEESVTERELNRIKKLNRRDFIDRLRSNETLAGTLATLEVQIGWQYLTQYLARMEAVTPADVQRVARQYLKPHNRSTVYVLPGEDAAGPAQPYSEVRSLGTSAARGMTRPSDFENHSEFPTPPGWRHPLSFQRTPEKIIFPRADEAMVGPTPLFYLADRQLPFIDLTLLVKAGSVDLPDSLSGLDSLLEATWIRGGTDRYTPEQLALALDESAVDLSISIGEESSVVRLSALREDWDQALKLLAEVLGNPRFDAQILSSAKSQIITALGRQGDDPDAVARREWSMIHFAGSPYGRDPLKALETIEGIGSTEMAAFVERYWMPANIVAAVSGDISAAQAKADLQKLLAELPDSQPPARAAMAPERTPPVLALIHKPGQVQSQVVFGLPGVLRTDPDFWKLNLLASIYGGQDSLLHRRLRDDLGLVYSTYFYQSYKWEAGLLMGYMGCQGNHTALAIEEALQVMAQLRENVDSQEFALKQLDALNSFVFNVDTPRDLVEVYAHYALRQEPLDTLERIQQQFFAADESDMLRLAREHFEPNDVQIVVVADKHLPTTTNSGESVDLGERLEALAAELGLAYQEIALR